MKKGLGFTLIELLVVISIVGILTALISFSYTSAQRQTRDAGRRSNLAQYQSALENFANSNSDYYPSYASTVRAATSLCGSLSRIISGCPEDLRYNDDNSFVYNYQSNGTDSGTTTATQYVLWSKLENTADYWVVCSRGKSGTKSQTGFSVSGGNCPI